MKHTGRCRICGEVGDLSFEHVPPKSVFNSRPVIASRFDAVIGKGPDESIRGRQSQRGKGAWTLCERCNNRTGAWYAPDFTAWCCQAFEILAATGWEPTLHYPQYLFPLRVIKQIVTMFFSVNHEGFRDAYPLLAEFVLNRESRAWDSRAKVYAYYNHEGKYRSTGVVFRGSFDPLSPGFQKPLAYSETNFPPFGFVMTYDSEPPDKRLVDITHFRYYAYRDFKILNSRYPALPTHLWIPGDYRSKEKIQADYEKNVGVQAVQPEQP